MVGIDDFSRIVSAIYASALTPENWIVAMADIRRTLDAQSAGLLLADGAGRSIKSASLPPEAQNAYSEYYCQIDYVLDAVEKGPLGLIRSGQPLVALKARFAAGQPLPVPPPMGALVGARPGSELPTV